MAALLAAGKLPYLSIESFDAAVATNGSCRCFGWDGSAATVFKVPKLNDVYIEAGTAASAGEFIGESLPNLKGYFGQWKASVVDGVLFQNEQVTSFCNSNDGGADSCWYSKFNAGAYSSTYQDGAKVRPDSVRYRAMVQLVATAPDDALADYTNVLNEVAGKANASQFQVVSELPAEPDANTFYFIPET